ncbi:unnamed protein product [Discosporangium mesarthrocarpum]
MMKTGGYGSAFSTFDKIFRESKKLLIASGFMGVTTWVMISSFFYLAERNNPDMVWIYPSCYSPYSDDDQPQGDRPDCPNRFRSITSSSYFTLLNLFGEFPLIGQHNTAGKFISVFTAVVAVAVFAIPTGIFGAGFEEMIHLRKKAKLAEAAEAQALLEASAVGESAGGEGASGEVDGGAAAGGEASSFFQGGVTGEKFSMERDMSFRVGNHFMQLDPDTPAGKRYRMVIYAVIALDTLAFFVSTLPGIQEEGKNSEVSVILGALEVFSVGLFTLDYLSRVFAAASENWLMEYIFSFYGMVDLLSVLPFYVGLATYGGLDSVSPLLLPTVVRALRLLRMLKAERYVKAFSVFDDVILSNLDILAVSGFFAVVVWVFASSLLYYTERFGPDPNITPYYQSVPMAMWITLLNLSGEAPLCDYSMWGKIITAILGLFGVGVFAVPVGLVGAGFEEWVDSIAEDDIEDAGEEEQQEEEVDASGTLVSGEEVYSSTMVEIGYGDESTVRGRLYRMLEAKTPDGRVFESFIMFLIIVTVAQAIIMTVPSMCEDAQTCSRIFDFVEFNAVLVFTVEYLLRLYAAPERYPHMSPCWARLRYMVSFYAIIDALATFPYYAAQLFVVVDRIDNYLRLLRLLRLLKLDRYTPCVSLVDDVFRLKARGLLIAGYASAVMLAWFSTLLYLAERDDYEVQVDCYYEAQRFSSVPMALQYDLILLTGDYPLIDFSLAGRYINFVQIVVAVGVVAVPSGLIANGFTEILQEKRLEKYARRRKAVTKLQSQVRGFFARRAFRMVVEGAQAIEEKAKELLFQKRQEEAEKSLYERVQLACYRLLSGRSAVGYYFQMFIGMVIVLNVVAVLAESEPSLGDTSEVHGTDWQAFFDAFEAFSVAVFTFEIILRIFTAPISSKYGGSVWSYVFSFYGIIDFASVLPWYIELFATAVGLGIDVSVFRVLRLFRILQLEHFVSAFTLLDDVWLVAKDTLAATAILALIVWVGSAALFYIFEKDNECVGDSFNSIPNAMYFVAVFLGGDWGEVDFSWPGKILCVILCVMGIALFAIPVGTVFEAFNDVLLESTEEEEEVTGEE